MENQEQSHTGRQQQYHRMVINLIACIDKNGGIGYRNHLLFHIKKDMERFRLLTMGHTIIMGRKTYDSLPNGALPNRHNIVITHQDVKLDGCEICHTVEEALQTCRDKEEVFIIGGASVYEQTIQKAHRLYLTIVDKITQKVDSMFPAFNKEEWRTSWEEEYTEVTTDGSEVFRFTFVILENKILQAKAHIRLKNVQNSHKNYLNTQN